MKYRIIVPLFLAAAIGAAGWRGARRLEAARERQAQALKESVIPGAPQAEAGVKHKAKTRDAESPPQATGKVHPDDIAYLRNMGLKKTDRTQTPEQDREQFAKLIDRLKAMNPAQVRRYITEVRTLEDLPERSRLLLIEMAVGTLADNHPPDGLDIYLELIKQFPKEDREFSVESKITNWTKKDPAAALAWIRTNMAENGSRIPDGAKAGVITVIARKDPKEAFRLIRELEVGTPSNVTQGIVLAAKTPEERLAALAALREYLPTIRESDDYDRAADYSIAAFGRQLANEGFQAATDWARTAGLTPAELASFGGDLGTSVKDGDEGQWILWLGENLPNGRYSRGIRNIMVNWADDNHQASGTWLTSAPAGPVKNFAVSVFAERVAKAEPETAEQWALTLPEGKQRADTLDRIFHNWPEGNPEAKAAAAEFEKKHGIVHDH